MVSMELFGHRAIIYKSEEIEKYRKLENIKEKERIIKSLCSITVQTRTIASLIFAE